jgi:hypothetical protein
MDEALELADQILPGVRIPSPRDYQQKRERRRRQGGSVVTFLVTVVPGGRSISVDVVEDPARNVAYPVPSHTFQFNDRLGQVTLTAPRGSTTFRVQKVEQREGETVYRLGERISDGKNGPYPGPSADREIDRLVNEIGAAGGDVTQASAWAEGEGYVDHITRLRKTLRDLRSRPGSRQRTCG